ncbi:MAG: 4-alpha-glucanotransferase [Nitrospirales bacterium]
MTKIIRKTKYRYLNKGNVIKTSQNDSLDSTEPGLRELARSLGLEPDYVDGRQQERYVSDDTLLTVLKVLGVGCRPDLNISTEGQRLQQKQWTRVLEPVLLHYPHEKKPLTFQMTLPMRECLLEPLSFRFLLHDEQGKTRSFIVKGSSLTSLDSTVIHETRYVRVEVTLSSTLRLGYFDLSLHATIGENSLEEQSLIISAPQRCYLPDSKRKVWGVGLQLYGIRSRNNWGIGDFRDLGKIMKVAGQSWKASTVGLQPLHSLTPWLYSPYSPSSRLFWNPLYLNLENVAEFRNSPSVMRKFRGKKFQAVLQSLRDSRLVNYEAVQTIKSQILEELFRVFQRRHIKGRTSRGRVFSRFVRQSQPHLTRFCTFQALSEFFQSSRWREWPPDFHQPDSPAVEQFGKRHAARIQFFHYVQWLCEVQLSALNRLAQKVSLSLGLYHDFPVGVHPDGADAWSFQDQLASDITVGAPPDSFNLRGQNWGLLSPNPLTLREKGYQFLRQTLRQNMRHGGVLRIDHALGLFRMFWIPQGGTGKDGVYVRTYVEEVLAVLALESVRNKVMVVGEDLGAVTPAIRHKLDKAGLLSYRLLLFERESDGRFLAPHQFPEQALVAATTHDLPTLKGYWVGRDIEVKEEAGLYPQAEDLDRDWTLRAEDRLCLWDALDKEGLCPTQTMSLTLSKEMLQVVYRYLARTPSRLLVVQLEDLLAELETPNLPGALETAYPSWRMRTQRELNVWLNDPVVLKFAQAIHRERRLGGASTRKTRKTISSMSSS